MSGYLDLPGTEGENALTVDAAALGVTAKLGVEVDCALDWDADQANPIALASKWGPVGNRSWMLLYGVATGLLTVYYSHDGSGSRTANSPSLNSLKDDGDRVKIRVNKTSGTAVQWYLDDVSWGSEQTITDTTINVGNADVIIGDRITALPADGRFYGCKIWNDTTLVFDADFTDLTRAEVVAESFVEDSVNAAAVTLNGSTWQYVREYTKVGDHNLAGSGQLLVTGG